jgi:hypothetical protein
MEQQVGDGKSQIFCTDEISGHLFLVLRMGTSDMLVSGAIDEVIFVVSILVLFGRLAEFLVYEHTLIDASLHLQMDPFQNIFCKFFTLHWVKTDPDAAKEIYFFLLNANKKHSLPSSISHHGRTQLRRL